MERKEDDLQALCLRLSKPGWNFLNKICKYMS